MNWELRNCFHLFNLVIEIDWIIENLKPLNFDLKFKMNLFIEIDWMMEYLMALNFDSVRKRCCRLFMDLLLRRFGC